jgi:AcrR family transcriptional regulator
VDASHSQNPLATPGSPRLRADARANQALLVDAARDLFSTHGIEVPLSAIARRAGVSSATLYRRFPTREALVAEVFAEELADCEAVLAQSLTDEDPWRGLCRLLLSISDMQARSRGFSGAFLARYPGAIDLDAKREHADRDLRELVRRAQEAGSLRADFDHSDVYLLLLAVDALAAQPPEIARAAARRLVSYVLQAARSGRTAPLPPPAPLEVSALHQVPGR